MIYKQKTAVRIRFSDGCFYVLYVLYGFKSIIYVGDYIVYIFNADGKSYEVGGYAAFREFLVRKLTVSGACGVKNAGSRIGDVCDYGGKL